MQKALIKLLEQASKKTGLAESTLSFQFGNTHAAKRIRSGSASLDTAERFKTFLEKKVKGGK